MTDRPFQQGSYHLVRSALASGARRTPATSCAFRTSSLFHSRLAASRAWRGHVSGLAIWKRVPPERRMAWRSSTLRLGQLGKGADPVLVEKLGDLRPDPLEDGQIVCRHGKHFAARWRLFFSLGFRRPAHPGHQLRFQDVQLIPLAIGCQPRLARPGLWVGGLEAAAAGTEDGVEIVHTGLGQLGKGADAILVEKLGDLRPDPLDDGQIVRWLDAALGGGLPSKCRSRRRIVSFPA